MGMFQRRGTAVGDPAQQSAGGSSVHQNGGAEDDDQGRRGHAPNMAAGRARR